MHYGFVPRGSTVNVPFYVVMEPLKEKVRRKRPMRTEKSWMLHHDNAR